MSFTTFSGFNNPFFSARTATSPNTATFGTLSAFGEVPLVGISGKFATYSVLNNGVELATGQTASTYTITGLGNNVQIGPVTLVPYDNLGVAGTPFAPTGGSGGGKIYTWAQADTPTFSATTSTGTTLACTGAFSKVYVTFSGGSASPASGTLITGTNSISQAYTGMAASTPYTFVIYPVNGDGIPASVTGTNFATGIVNTSAPPPQTVWVAAGYANLAGNTFAYSTNGTAWTGLGYKNEMNNAYFINYWSDKKCWVCSSDGSTSGNSMCYSSNGVTWTGIGKTVFDAFGNESAYSIFQKCWVITGYGTGNSIAYSSNAITWTGLGRSIFVNTGSYSLAYGVAYSEFQKCWVAAGLSSPSISTGNTLAYSSNAITWTGLGKIAFTNPKVVSYSEYLRCWVVGGTGTGNTIGYSSNGINWTGLGVVYSNPQDIKYDKNHNFWVCCFGYSSNGINWTNITIPHSSPNGLRYSELNDIWISAGISSSTGNSGNSFAYSTNGINWTGLGPYTSIYYNATTKGYPVSIGVNQ